MPAEIGQPAPDFTLKNHDGQEVSLSDYRGDKAVALVFFAFTFSGICEDELCQIRDDFAEFASADVQVVAVSCNARHAQGKWAEENGYEFPVLSDFWPHGEVTQAYGVFNEVLGAPHRATFLIDRDGVVVDHFQTPDVLTPREKERYTEALAKLG